VAEEEDSLFQWLSLVPGLGRAKIKKLIEAGFSTLELLQKAKLKEVADVEGIGPLLAARIKEFVEKVEPVEELKPKRVEKEPSILLCSHCGALITEKMKRCEICGAQLTEEGEKWEEEAVDGFWYREKPSLYICTNCGAIVSEKTEKCGICGAELKEIEEDIEVEKEKIKRPPSMPRIKRRKGVTKDFLRRWERVKEVKIEEFDKELKRCDELLKAHPEDVATLKKKAYLLVQLGMYNEALKTLEEAQRIKPVEEEEYKLEVLNILRAKEGLPAIELEEELEDREQIEDALKYYDRLLEIDPTMERAWQTKGELLEKLGRSGEAVKCFEKAIEAELARQTSKKLIAFSALRNFGAFEARPSKFLVKKELDRGVKGLVNATGRMNGLINGLVNGRINGLINGRGKVNDLVTGLVNGNGLINGEGLYNGRGLLHKPKIKRVGEPMGRAVAIVAAVLTLIIITPILSSFLFVVPVVHAINIDGDFADWNKVKGYEDEIMDQVDNEDINIIRYKVHQEDSLLSIYAMMDGVILRGKNETDTFFAFIDSDRDEYTGYDIGGIGADSVAVLQGWNNEIKRSILYSFQKGGDSNNWSAFYREKSVKSAIDEQQLELRLELELEDDVPKVLLFAQDSFMNYDSSDAVITKEYGALKLKETTIAPKVVTETRFPMLKIQLWAHAREVMISSLIISKDGNMTDSMLNVFLYNDLNANGIFDAPDALISSSTVENSEVDFEIEEKVVGERTMFLVADVESTSVHSLGLRIKDVVADATITVSQGDMTNVYVGYPQKVAVDGAFADWDDVSSNPDADNDITNPLQPIRVNENIDIRNYKLNLTDGSISFYLKVDGNMLGGVDAPVISTRPPPPSNITDRDRDTVPDEYDLYILDFNNNGTPDQDTNNDVDEDGIQDYPIGLDYWLNTTIPLDFPEPYRNRTVTVYIGPAPSRPIRGTDKVMISIDSDGNASTGLLTYIQSNMFGFDYLIVITGRNEKISSNELFRYNGTSNVPWEYVENVSSRRDTDQLEVSALASKINLGANYSVFFRVLDWRFREDVSDTHLGTKSISSESTKSPAGDNVVLNEISSLGSPEWIELANPTGNSIDLSGWTIQIKQGNNWITIYTFSAGSTIGAWGSGSEYLAVDLAANSLPDKGVPVRLVDAVSTEVDYTKYPRLAAGETRARYKDGTDGKPVDTDQDSKDWYKSASPSKGGPNDLYRPVIIVAKSADKAETSPGDTITYTIYYDNNGEGVAKNVWINDTLPNNVTYQSSSEPYDSFSSQTYRWNFTDVLPGAHSFTITVRVNDDTPDDTSLVNNVNLNYTDQLNRTMESSSDSTTTICRKPMITVVKVADKDIAEPGDKITYTVYYNNTGTGDASNVWVNDTLPDYVTFKNSVPRPDSITGQILRWHFTDVTPGTHSIKIVVTVNPDAPDKYNLTNLACLNYTAASGLQYGESCDTAITVVPEFHDVMIPIFGVLIIFFVVRRRKKIQS